MLHNISGVGIVTISLCIAITVSASIIPIRKVIVLKGE